MNNDGEPAGPGPDQPFWTHAQQLEKTPPCQAQCPNSGDICYNGACRRLCPMPSVTPDGDCMRVDVQFNLCRADGMGRSLCTSSNEVMPQCARS